ncbi:MAG TPA: dTMP kinase [Acholeplasmataceae bacterium]|jgi:dTMP kinase|nr:dTMP kinase [Acholeplasmataceae bacterium]
MFITFEGGEGSGKTTIIENLYQNLLKKGYQVLKTREPGGSRISEEIRNIILNVNNLEMDYRTEALLYAASRRQHLVEVIVPALKAGKVVLCDRYLDSSLAYQGVARGLGIKEVYQINQYATEGILPNLTFYIDLKPEIGLSRIKHSERIPDRLDLEKGNFHDTVREGYLQIAKMFPERIKVIDGNRPVEVIEQEIMAVIVETI